MPSSMSLELNTNDAYELPTQQSNLKCTHHDLKPSSSPATKEVDIHVSQYAYDVEKSEAIYAEIT